MPSHSQDRTAGPTSDALEPYARAWRRRSDRAAETAAHWRQAIRERLPLVVDMLVRDFNATRITLFGSFATGQAAPGSDIDLLVEGVASERIIDAIVVAERILRDVPVDLVPSRLAHPQVRLRVVEEGVVLHG